MIAILPFKKPFISHVPYDNCVLGILQNYSQTYDWIYTNFINIYINQRTGKDYFYPVYLWKICPFLDEFSLPFCFIKKSFSLYTDFLEYCLYNEFYVYNVLNIKYIMKYNVHINDVHNSFVYGIDSEKRVVKLCDFYKDGVYESHDCPYDEINKAFSSIPECAWYGGDDFLNEYTKTIMLKFNDRIEYKFSYDIFRNNVKNYLTMEDLINNNYEHVIAPSCYREDKHYWGANCWNQMKNNYTLRYFSLLVSYSKMWIYRYDYFVKKKYMKADSNIKKTIDEFYQNANMALCLYLKMFAVKKKDRILSIQASINILIEKCQKTDFIICNYFVEKSN